MIKNEKAKNMKKHEKSAVLKDPVCGMDVKRKGPTVFFEKEIYHFCSDACRKEFSLSPDNFIKKSGKIRLWARYPERLNRSTAGIPPASCQ